MAGERATATSRARWRRVRLLLLVAVVLIALIALYATVPPPTVLAVRVADGDTGTPLAGAQVVARIPGQDALPAVATGDDGLARLEFLEGQAGYRVQVQKVDYDLWSMDSVTVVDEQETELPVPLVHNPGRRLHVGIEGARVVQVDVASLLRIQTVVLPVASEAPVRFLRLHPTQDLLYAVAGAKGLVLSSLTGATLETFGVQASAIDSLEVSADGRYVLATGTLKFDPADYAQHKRLWFLDAQSGALVTDTLLSGASTRVDLEWQPDGVDSYILLATSSIVDRASASSAALGRLGNVAFRARGYPNRLYLSASGEWLYTWTSMTYSFERAAYVDSLAMVSMEDGAAVYQDVTPGVVALAVSPVKEELFVLNQDLGTLTLLDLTGEREQGLVPVGKQPVAMTVSRDGTRVYVADRGSSAVIVVDVDSMRVVASIPLPAEPLSIAVR